MDGKSKKITKKVLLYVLLIILALIWIVPIFTLVATALKHKKDFMSGLSLFQLPAEIAWDNFTNAITKGNLFNYMKNDLIISCLKVPLGIFVGAMASFALTRLNIKHRVGIFVFFLIGMMLPMQTALVPINIIYSKLNLLNTYFGLFYVYIGFGISYCILIMRGFMLGIPKDIDEAACIDNDDVCFHFIVHQCKAVRPKNAKHDFGIHKVFITAQGNKKDCQVIGICITHKYYLSVFWRRTASTQLYISMAMVIGTTPPGTGVIALTRSMTSSRSTSPQSLFCSFR